MRDGRVTGVVTDQAIEAEFVVNAGGIWAHELGRLAGVEIPVVPMEHQYLITRPIEGVPTSRRSATPTTSSTSGKRSAASSWAATSGTRTLARDRSDPVRLQPSAPAREVERFESIADGAFRLIPPLQTTEINRFINGPEAFTPDDDFILGETEVAGFFVAAGFCAHG